MNVLQMIEEMEVDKARRYVPQEEWNWDKQLEWANIPSKVYTMLRVGRLADVEVANLTKEVINSFVRRLYAKNYNAEEIKWILWWVQNSLKRLKSKRKIDYHREYRRKNPKPRFSILEKSCD